jgi:hypothetical protein
MDIVVDALRTLGAAGPAHAEDILDAAGAHFSARERSYILGQLRPGSEIYDHEPDPVSDVPHQRGVRYGGVDAAGRIHYIPKRQMRTAEIIIRAREALGRTEES